jgi:hypothetical protein
MCLIRRNILLIGGDVFVDSEMSMVTLLILRSGPLTWSFRGVHRAKYAFIGINACVCTMFLKKTKVFASTVVFAPIGNGEIPNGLLPFPFVLCFLQL